MERDNVIKMSQSKIIFRDFSVPVHHGKRRLQRTEVGSRANSTVKDHVDIISNKVQATLKTIDQEKMTKQERIREL